MEASCQLRTWLQDERLARRIEEYLTLDKNESNIQQVNQLIADRDEKELDRIFRSRLAFGTAGIRGRMGPGYGQMNDLIIIQTSQGLARYLSHKFGNGLVVIGYDARHNSRHWAGLAGRALATGGHEPKIFPHYEPTPMIPFSVRALGAVAGIVVTASHNPKHDNGYKVYFKNGAQLLSPHDEGIQEEIEKNLNPWNDMSWVPFPEDPNLVEMEEKYLDTITGTCEKVEANARISISFTSLHGVGGKLMKEALRRGGFVNSYPVKSQEVPDPHFPTVVFPNPEEGDGVLNESIKSAGEHGCSLIIANDPDADRCAVAEKRVDSAGWRVFNGNEIGMLLADWLWRKFRSRHPNVPPSKCHMISSTVSSKFLQTMAAKEGFKFHETLTGFKWMGNLAHEIMESSGYEDHIIFAFEEAIGYMIGNGRDSILDKDGICAGLNVAEMAASHLSEGTSLEEQLTRLFRRYGFHTSYNSYFLCYESSKIHEIFRRISHFDPQLSQDETNAKTEPRVSYPTQFNTTLIRRVRDLNSGYDTTGVPNLPVSQSSYMITFYMEPNIVLTIRTSGTEPKIKFYSEAISDPGEDESNWKRTKENLRSVVDEAVSICLEPEKNGLAAKSN